jgi:hypothetical protein
LAKQTKLAKLPLFLALGAGILAPSLASAVTRTIYFTQSARNVTVEGIGEAATSTCRIILSNPSNQNQSYTLVIRASATGTGAGGATLSEGAGCSTSGGVITCTGSLAGDTNASASFTISYPPYPTRGSGTFAGSQTVICSGHIVATDPGGGNPGFLMAGGSILTFTESGALQTTNSTGGVTFFAGQAVYSQLPISINGGRPF